MNRVSMITLSLIASYSLIGCEPEESIETEVSTVTDEGPYGGYSVTWYKVHWDNKTRDQRRWCQQQVENPSLISSCVDATTGWKQGWRDPETNPPRRWKDGSHL